MTAKWVALITRSRIISNQRYVPCSLYQMCLVHDTTTTCLHSHGSPFIGSLGVSSSESCGWSCILCSMHSSTTAVVSVHLALVTFTKSSELVHGFWHPSFLSESVPPMNSDESGRKWKSVCKCGGFEDVGLSVCALPLQILVLGFWRTVKTGSQPIFPWGSGGRGLV